MICLVVENKWSVGPTMTFCRANVAVALVNERLWAVGGFNGKDFLRSVEFLDENSEEWTNILTIGENKSESNENLVKESEEEEVVAVSEGTDDLAPQDLRYVFTVIYSFFFKIILFPFYSEEQSELKINNVEEPDKHSEEKPTNQVEEDTCENNDAENGETNGEVTNE